MNYAEMESNWQKALQPFFPGVVVQYNPGIRWESLDWLDVYFVPDSRMGEFAEFFVYEAGKLVETLNLPDMDLMSHSISETRKHYPKVWAEFRPKIKSAKSSTPRPRARKPSTPRKSLAPRPVSAK